MKFLNYFILFSFLFFLLNIDLKSQENQNGQKVTVKTAKYFDISKPLTEMKPIKGFILEEKYVVKNFFRESPPPKSNKKDELRQSKNGAKAAATILHNFAGSNNGDNATGVAPPDTQGDVGPNHYFQAVNNVAQIWDKNGTSLWGPENTSVFWDGFSGSWTGTNDGDPIVLYDQDADRWLVSQFAVNTGDGTQWELVAISTSADPTGSYYRYAFEFTDMPDYPKLGVWADGYYLSANRFTTGSGNYNGTYVAALERDEMLIGNPSAIMILIENGSGDDPYSLLPADCDGTLPAVGTPCPFVYDTDDDTYWSSDKVKVWNFTADWTTPANSTFTQVASLTPTAFNSNFSAGIDQPGTSDNLDVLNDRMMFRAQYMPFTDYNSIVVSRTVNTGSNIAGIRWYELRQVSGTWSIYQEGTYAPGDGNSRWMPSIAQNSNGEIALGYSVSGASTYPSIRVTGRYPGDALNQMTITETSIQTGSASQTGVTRWGDYSMMSVDPSDDDFWYTQEYSNGGWNWATKIAEFNFPSLCTPPTTQASNFGSSAIGDNQMTVSWTRGNGNQVLVVAKEGSAVATDPSSGTSYTANSVFGSGDEIGSGNFVVYKGTGTNVTVTGLNPGTTYYYAIYEFFTADNCYLTPGLAGNATTTGTAPCDPCYSWGNTSYATSTTLVQFNTINNSSAKPTDGNGNAYSDYTSISTDVLIGSSYDLTVNVNTDGDYTIYSMAWIDWNQDCDFLDAGEEYDLGTATNTANGPTSNSPLSITVPVTALTGNTTMRVSSKYDSAPTSCETDFDGEVEDYTINVISATAPTIIVNPTSIDFGGVGIGYYSEDSYDVSGVNLTNDITITAPADFQISLTAGSGYSNPIVLTQSGGTVNATTIYVRFEPAAEQMYSGNITNASSGATTKNVAVTGEGVQWFPAPRNLAGTLNGTNADLSWDPPATNNSTTGWYEYADFASATYYSSGAYIRRLAYFKADELSYTYPIKISQLRGSFFESSGNWNGHNQFYFVIYGEDMTTLLYQSPVQTAVSGSTTTFTIPDGIIITGDFFMGVETVTSDGAPFSTLKQQADNNYHTYVYDGTDWYVFSDGTHAYDADFGVYIDGAKGGKYVSSSNWSPAQINAQPTKDKIVLTTNNPKSALTGYIVYRDGTDISGTLSSTQTTYTDNNICGNSYNYRVTAVYDGYAGESDSSNLVTLALENTTITTQPTSQSKCLGESVTFTVVASGSGTLTYQWKKGGTNITGATSASYTIASVAAGDAASYTCVVTGTCGSVTSNAATLTINAATTITTQPTSQSKCLGESVTFTVVASGSGTLTYQWKKDGTNISGATSASYSITSVAAGDAASYTCVVTGTCGSVTSNAATLTINAATTITTQPTSQTKCAGESVTFTVVASGSGTLTYQWKKDGTNISGATSASYTIASVAAGDAASYTCVVTGTCGSVTSNAATLTINATTTITTQPTAQTACSGGSATFTVIANGSNISYQWYKTGVAISGATSASYTLSNVSAVDAANYYCIVSGDCGDVTSNTVSLTVNPATEITDQSSSQTACAGSDVTFFVTATGTGLSYQWTKDGSNITGQTSSSLTLNSVSIADEGTYVCEITGTCGNATSNNMVLTISTSLTVGDPTNQLVCPNGDANFTVTANGTNLTYQWKKDGSNLSNGGNISGATSATLTVSNCSASDEANYSCYVTSDCGNDESATATLTLNVSTAITTQPESIDACEGDNATFTLIASGSNLSYQWYKGGVSISGATNSTYTINNVTLTDEDNFYCEVTGDCGMVQSNTVTLSVGEATAITTQPVGSTICEGDNYTFSVVASGAGLTYQWQLDGSDITGATSASYSITGATSGDAGDYTCVVTGTCGSATSNAATLTINAATTITTQPTNQTTCTGGDVTFSIIAENAIGYQWLKDGVDITGETNADLILNVVTVDDEGDYSCVVTGTCNNVTSQVATLTVVSGAEIITQPVSQDICEANSVTFTVEAAGSNLTYQWRKDGTDITGETNATLTISSVSTSDEGAYSCYVNSDCGNITSDAATLTVLPLTEITTQPVSVTDANLGETVVFTVVANGSNLAYQWYKDASELTGETTDTYTIMSVQETDEGNYNVEVSGDCGTEMSETAVLTVITDLETLVEFGMKVYPNPNNGRFTIEFDKIVTNMEVNITDASGRIIYYGNLNSKFNHIDLNDHTAGVYILKLYDQNTSKTVKIIVR